MGIQVELMLGHLKHVVLRCIPKAVNDLNRERLLVSDALCLFIGQTHPNALVMPYGLLLAFPTDLSSPVKDRGLHQKLERAI